MNVVKHRLAETPLKEKQLTQALFKGGFSQENVMTIVYNYEDILLDDPVTVLNSFGEAVFIFYDDVDYEDYRNAIVYLTVTEDLSDKSKARVKAFVKNNKARYAKLQRKTKRLKKTAKIKRKKEIEKVRNEFNFTEHIGTWKPQAAWVEFAKIVDKVYEKDDYDTTKIKDAKKIIQIAEAFPRLLPVVTKTEMEAFGQSDLIRVMEFTGKNMWFLRSESKKLKKILLDPKTLIGLGRWNKKALKEMSLSWRETQKKRIIITGKDEIYGDVPLTYSTYLTDPMWQIGTSGAGNFLFYDIAAYQKYLEKEGLTLPAELLVKMKSLLKKEKKEKKEKKRKKKEKLKLKEEKDKAWHASLKEGMESIRLIPKPIRKDLYINEKRATTFQDSMMVYRMAEFFPILLRGKIDTKGQQRNIWLASEETGWSDEVIKSMAGKEDPVFPIHAKKLAGFGYWDTEALKKMSDWKIRKSAWEDEQNKKLEKRIVEHWERYWYIQKLWKSNASDLVWLMQAIGAGNFIFYDHKDYQKFLTTLSKKRYTSSPVKKEEEEEESSSSPMQEGDKITFWN